MLKIGDSVGSIIEYVRNDVLEWGLCESEINKIVETKNSRKYYTKKEFKPLDADDVDLNTKKQEKASGYILIKEVFGLNEITRPKAENWIEWANENIDDVKGVF